MMNESQVEEMAALAQNWREAAEAGDAAASQAFEDELHERITVAGIRDLEAPDPGTGEASAVETVRLRNALETIRNRASTRLD